MGAEWSGEVVGLIVEESSVVGRVEAVAVGDVVASEREDCDMEAACDDD